MNRPRILSMVAIGIALAQSAFAAEPGYDPLAVGNSKPSEPVDLTVADDNRKREIPIRVFLPADKQPASVVMFSHGLGGSREMSSYLGKHWAARGYAAVFLQHPGSDTSVWKGKPLGQRMTAMQEAAGGQNFLLRVKDVPAVLDDLARRTAEKNDPLFGRLDVTRVGMSGHSFGAITTQAVSGQTTPRGRRLFTDPRIKAAVIMSPSTPRGGEAQPSFANVQIPWLLMTGTNDLSIIGGTDMKSRLGVYPALPAGGKYELVLHEANHSAFTDRPLPGDKGTRNPNHHRTILALSTAFWDAYLKEDATAKAWLDGDGPRGILEADDAWQRK